MSKVTTSFTLDTQEDRDILQWLHSLPKREKSKAIRRALRAACNGQQGITLADIYDAIQELRRLGMVMVPAFNGHEDEPHDIAASLDNLGL